MFLDEARIASFITHPNVCSVFDFGEADGEFFIAMDYLVGETLGVVMRHTRRSPTHASSPRRPAIMARIVAEACEGLHAAHELRDAKGNRLNVVHRDVSPQNLFVTYDGSVRVVDFGIASAAHRIHETSTGQIKGKFSYMAPEQLAGSQVDRRADVWALGVILWEALAMKPLFRRSNHVETMHAVVNALIERPSKLNPALPAELDGIVLKALSRKKSDRYATARELGQDLVRFLGMQGDPVGLADIAGWMEEILPAELAQKQQLVTLARNADKTIPPVYSTERDTSSTGLATGVREKSEARRRAPFVVVGAIVLLSIATGLVLGRVLPDEAPAEGPDGASAAAREAGRPSAAAPAASAAPPLAAAPAAATVPASPPAEPAKAIPTPRPVAPSKRRPETSRQAGQSASASPEPPPRDAAPAAGEGHVTVVTPGSWAHVYDRAGSLLGTTPARLTLPAGSHTLQLRFNGQPPPVQVTARVRAGEITRLVQRPPE
jgi:serine/threonine-protein kinase